MKEFQLTIDERLFNLLWRSISERENELVSNIQLAGEESDEAALIGNDLVYLRLTKKSLENKANSASFSSGSFSLEEGFIDLSSM